MKDQKERWKYILATVRVRKTRSWLTILGIVIGIAAIIGLITLSESMNEAVQEQFEKMGISSIRVVPGSLHGPPTGSLGLPLDIKEKIEDVKGVAYANPVLLDYATAEFNNEKKTVIINSYDTALSEKGFLDTDLKTAEGTFFHAGERGAVVIGADIAIETFRNDILLKNTVKISGRKFKVIGILEDSGTDADDRIYMGLEDAQELFQKSNMANVFVVQTTEGIDIQGVAERIQKKLLKTMNEEEFNVFTPEQLLEQIGAMIGVIQIVLASIAAISLFVGAIGIMNSMFTAVLERTGEIGVMKAIGATNKDIVSLFVLEAGTMGFAGGLLGTGIGTALAYVVGFGARTMGYPLFTVKINWSLIVSTLLLSFVLGVIAGALPAWRAARMKPVDALRYE